MADPSWLDQYGWLSGGATGLIGLIGLVLKYVHGCVWAIVNWCKPHLEDFFGDHRKLVAKLGDSLDQQTAMHATTHAKLDTLHREVLGLKDSLRQE